MGQYINIIEGNPLGASFESKLKVLLEAGAEAISAPTEWEEGLVCVIDNGVFAAAGYAFDKDEMKVFIDGRNGRPWQWVKYENAKQYAQ